MKKSLFFLFIAIQSTAAFATTQVLQCKGVESDEVGEVKKPISMELRIVHPDPRTLLVINGEGAASKRAAIKIEGVSAIQIHGINVTNLRKAISFSGYSNKFSVSVYVPFSQVGAAGEVSVNMSRVTSDNEHLSSNLVCHSSLVNSL